MSKKKYNPFIDEERIFINAFLEGIEKKWENRERVSDVFLARLWEEASSLAKDPFRANPFTELNSDFVEFFAGGIDLARLKKKRPSAEFLAGLWTDAMEWGGYYAESSSQSDCSAADTAASMASDAASAVTVDLGESPESLKDALAAFLAAPAKSSIRISISSISIEITPSPSDEDSSGSALVDALRNHEPEFVDMILDAMAKREEQGK